MDAVLIVAEAIRQLSDPVSLLSLTTQTATPTESSLGKQLLDGLVEGLPNLFTVGVGGFLATLGWRFWRRPNLAVADDGVTVIPSALNDQTRAYRVRIKNTGRSAAENCKPHLDMTVRTDGAVTDVSTLCKWAEREWPTRTTINVGEVAEFKLLEYDEDADRVRFPSGDTQGSGADVFRYDEAAGREDRNAAPCIAVGARELTDGTVLNQTITVAAENASSVDRTIHLGRSDGDLRVYVGEKPASEEPDQDEQGTGWYVW